MIRPAAATTTFELGPYAVAFLDINGWHRGHTLVIPRRHVDDLVFGTPVLAELAPAIDAVARRLVERLDPDGVNVLSSARPAAGQTVFHAHMHVLGGRAMTWPPG